MSLAPLGFTVDTGPVAKAVGDLDRLTSATAKAQAGTKGISTAANAAAASVQGMAKATEQSRQANDNATAAVNRHAVAVARLVAAETRNSASQYADRAADIAAYGAEMDRIRAKFDPLFAAQQRYAAAIEEVNRAQQVGAITASTAIQVRLRETSAYQAQISVLHNLAAAQKASAQGMVDRVTVTPDRGADIAAYGAKLDQLRAKFSPLFAASKAYETELNDLNRAHRLGAITAAEQGSALVALNARYQMAATGAQTMGTSTAMARMQARNLAFQFQDIGTMLATGQSPFMLLAQQLPQVTMYGGRLNGVMAALKSTIGGIFSPLGLLTTGFVLAGSAAISYFSDAGDEANNAVDALAEQEDLIRRVADRWGDAVPEIRQYADELERTRELGELAQATIAKITESFDEARASVTDIRQEMSAALQTVIDMGATDAEMFALRDAFKEYNLSVKDVEKALKDGGDSTDEFTRFSRAMASLLANESVRSSDALTDAIYRLRDAYSAAANEGARAAGARSLLEDRGNIPISDFKGGRGSDPRDIETDDYWKSKYLPNPERAAKKARKARKPRKTDEERARERYDEMIQQSGQFIKAQELEQRALYMTEEAAQSLRFEQELLNQAANDNIKLTPEMSAELSNLAQEMAATEAVTAKLKESFDFTKDAAKGVLSSLRQDLMDGELSWRSFGDAAMSVLDKIIGKLEDEVATAFANAFAPQSGGGGFLSSIFGGFFGGGGGFKPNTTFGSFLGLPSMDGGGYTGPGPRSGGVDGKGGFLSVLHPRETVTDHTKNSSPANQNSSPQQAVIVNQTFQISGAISADEIKNAIQQSAVATKAEIQSGFARTLGKNQRAGLA